MDDIKKESQSKEENLKMTDEKVEQLQTPAVVEPKQVEQLKEETKVEQLEAKPVEVIPVEKLETKPVETKPVEQLEAKPAEVKVEEKECLNKEIKETKEELAVIKEVRDELVALYERNKDMEQLNANLTKEVEKIKGEFSVAREQLSRYEKAELEYNAKKRLERVEKLSANFKSLGQEKSVEHLSVKDDATIEEFEKIVEAALMASAQTKVMTPVTIPSQGMAIEQLSKDEKKPAVLAKSDVKKKESLKKESNSEFFSRMCKTLSKEQLSADRKTKFM